MFSCGCVYGEDEESGEYGALEVTEVNHTLFIKIRFH